MQTAHTAKDEGCRQSCQPASSSSLLQEPAAPTSPKKQPLRNTSPKQPWEAHVGPCQTNGPSRRRLAASILNTSSRKEMGSTRADEGLHDRTTSHMSSLPLATRGSSSDFAAGKSKRKASQTYRNKKPTNKVLPQLNHHSSSSPRGTRFDFPWTGSEQATPRTGKNDAALLVLNFAFILRMEGTLDSLASSGLWFASVGESIISYTIL
jgi:hypothetical protein